MTESFGIQLVAGEYRVSGLHSHAALMLRDKQENGEGRSIMFLKKEIPPFSFLLFIS
jgi:hypothetical protein